MCNISGYIGKKKANILTLKLLGIMGRSRGTDSFGAYFSGAIEKFTNPGDSFDIMLGTTINYQKNNLRSIFMMHNRSRTVGVVNKENAHPYEYTSIEGRHMVFMHNGTIKNIEELCEKYKITYDKSRTDSYHFGLLLYTHGAKILKEYEGFAAIAAYDVILDILYLFKGSSKCEADLIEKEERPLFIYQKSKDALYFNSTEEGLYTALNDSNYIFPLKANVLTGFKDGNIVSEKKIDRSAIKYKPPVYTNYNNNQSYGYNSSNNDTKTNLFPNNDTNRHVNRGTYFLEESPQNNMGNKVYFWRNQYYKNGHVLKGIWTIDDDGVGYALTEREIERQLLTDEDKAKYYYFHDGRMIKNYDTYMELINKNVPHTSYTMYDYANKIHPKSIYIRQYNSGGWAMYVNGTSLYTTWFTPIFSTFQYKVQGVDLIVEKTKNVKLINPQSLTIDEAVKQVNNSDDDDYSETHLENFQKALFPIT